MEIRKAELADLEGIFSIYNKVKLDVKKLGTSKYDAVVQMKGFLLGIDSQDDFISQIESSWGFFVAIENKKVIGYIIADMSHEFKDDVYKVWFDDKVKASYYCHDKGLSIMAIAVDPDHSKKGVAKHMMLFVEERALRAGLEYLFMVTTIAPVTNCAMIIWSIKNDFERLGMSTPREDLFGINWYASLLMYKRLR